ncbi:MAG: hypothetical protein JXQ96_05935 [Cyclobacteriaceae bacterium]
MLVEKKQISDEEAARQIGSLFPQLKDKLLNTIQLYKISKNDNSLIEASINKRIDEISVFRFSAGIKFSSNRKFIKYAAYPTIIALIIFLFIPQFFTESTKRILRYSEEFEPEIYFKLLPVDNDQIAFKNEDYTVRFKSAGSVVPENVYLKNRNRKVKMINNSGVFEYTFKKVQTSFDYHLESSAYQSNEYNVKVYPRPDIQNFSVKLNYPRYTQQQNQTINNAGNLQVPEGTEINWYINAISAESVEFSFSPDFKFDSAQTSDNQSFNYRSFAQESQEYEIRLKNEHSNNKNHILYNLEVIKDQYPDLSISIHKDTTLYSFLVFGGSVNDDYGISRLELVHRRKTNNETSEYESIRIPTGRNIKSQQYFYQWGIDSLIQKEGDQLEYFVRVWDNDGINGPKHTESAVYDLKLPSKSEINKSIEKQAQGAKNQIDKSLDEAKELKDQIENIQDKLKSKKQLDWQDKKQIKELLRQKEKLEREINELKDQNKAFSEKKERFSEQSEKLKEKVQQLQKLMDDLLDEETKKLYDELKKLLEEQKNMDKVQDMMDKIENKENNLEKEIERTLELFKKMQFDYKMEDIVNELEDLEEKQKDLAKETSDKSNDMEKLNEEQEELNEQFEEIEKDIEELEQLNDNLKNPEDLEDTSEDQEEISQEQQKSSEQLQNKQRKKASESQKKAGKKTEGLKKKMKEMQANMEMIMLEENIENLQDIVDNLVKVSFEQETIMKEFRGVNQSDPRYVTLSQRQLKLRDDSRIIEDSLMSLASRVFQIASFITRELDGMNDNIEASLQALKDRKLSIALSNQQFSMTSINNLALLLDDVLQQMQQQMSDAMGNPDKGKKGQKQKVPGLSELQKQLNQKIENLKKGGKSGRQLSEELAKLAAEQEMIRQKLQEMEKLMDEGSKGGKGGTKDAIKKMEQTEMDLVNKRISQQTIQRQKDILTRLLKAENAMRERELDKERKSEQGDELKREIPPKFEEYLQTKEKEIELLKTIPLKLNPYYKEEVNKYFKRLSEQ